jgi:hypothetical protein
MGSAQHSELALQAVELTLVNTRKFFLTANTLSGLDDNAISSEDCALHFTIGHDGKGKLSAYWEDVPHLA